MATAVAPALGVDIGIYYESRCRASQEFVEKQLLDIAPHARELQMAKVAIHPVPYGNTKETLIETGHYQYECQHGPEECYLNRVEACGMSVLRESLIHVWAPWVDCVNKSEIDAASFIKAEAHIIRAIQASQLAMVEAKRSRAAAAAAAEAARHGHMGPAAKDAAVSAMAAARAAHDAAMSSAEVTAAAAAAAAGGQNSWVMCNIGLPHAKVLLFEILLCSLSPAGERLQHLMAEQTPPHDYVPWVTVDHQHSTVAEKDLRCAICISPAGKEASLESFCAGKEGCDKGLLQHEHQDQAEQQKRLDHEHQQKQSREHDDTGLPLVNMAPYTGYRSASQDEV